MMRHRMSLTMMVGFVCVLMNNNGFCSDRNTERWILYEKSSEGSEFYCDVKSIISLNPEAVQVWTKEKLSKAMKLKHIQERVKNGFQTDGWDKLNEVITFQEIDCVKRTFKFLKTVFHNDDGNNLDLITYPNPKPIPIAPNSIGEELLNGVCPK